MGHIKSIMNSTTAPSDYNSTVNFLFEQLPMYSKNGKNALNPSLDNIKSFCAIMEHPEKKFKSIHIAGTNGKGSTSHILAASFQAAGYKTGLYTSPHLIDLRERIRINGALLEKEMLVSFVNQYWQAIQEIKPSYFELNVAMAFWAFAQNEVDIAIIETGLGGKWDSTNVIIPELSIITNISLDHTNILGNTIAAIASEKAGIIKPNVPVIIGSSQEETGAVFSKFAVLNQTNLQYADLMFDGAILSTNAQTQTFKMVANQDYSIFEIKTDLLGTFQLENIKTALAAITVLEQKGWRVNIEIFKTAIKQVKFLTRLRGRWDIIQTNPLTIADVGHNPNGIAVIVNQLQHPSFIGKKKHIVIGFVADKDVKEALSLLPKDAVYYYCQANVPRALAVMQLQTIGDEMQLNGKNYSNVKDAIHHALNDCDNEDLLLITGSFFIVGEALEYFDSKQIQKNIS